MSNGLLWGIIVVVLIVLGVWYFAYSGSATAPTPLNSDSGNNQSGVGATSTTGTSPGPSSSSTGMVERFTVVAQNFSFSPSAITVNRGDTIEITLQNVNGMHDLRVEGLNVGTKVIQAGQSDTFQFTASTPGTYTYFCSVGDHRARGMIGTLTVQ